MRPRCPDRHAVDRHRPEHRCRQGRRQRPRLVRGGRDRERARRRSPGHARHVHDRVPGHGAGPPEQGGPRDRQVDRDLGLVPVRRERGGPHQGRDHVDRGGLRHARGARDRARLRQVAPPRRRPGHQDLREREAVRHREAARVRRRPPDGRRRDRGHARPRVPGQPVQPRLPVRAGGPGGLRLPRRRRHAPVQGARRSPPTGRSRASRPIGRHDARVGREPDGVPGPDERRRAGQRGGGPRLGPQGEGGGHRQAERRRPRTPTSR